MSKYSGHIVSSLNIFSETTHFSKISMIKYSQIFNIQTAGKDQAVYISILDSRHRQP